jgi:hypothetical protein
MSDPGSGTLVRSQYTYWSLIPVYVVRRRIVQFKQKEEKVATIPQSSTGTLL